MSRDELIEMIEESEDFFLWYNGLLCHIEWLKGYTQGLKDYVLGEKLEEIIDHITCEEEEEESGDPLEDPMYKGKEAREENQ